MFSMMNFYFIVSIIFYLWVNTLSVHKGMEKNVFLHFLKSKLQIQQEIFTSKESQSVFNNRFEYILSKLE